MEFDTYILAYCPDCCKWFATNRRSFFYEYEKEFASEKEAIDYFKTHIKEFFDIEMQIAEYRPSIAYGKVWLSNTGELFSVEEESE